MKRIVLILLIALSYVSYAQTKKDFLNSKEAYFGLTPPGLIPEVFAPGIINHLAHSSPSFTPDGKEISVFHKMA